ncbi:MAG: hypothetical protein GXP16_08930 [Gammaproteobacteria bacterium]|nr:hypothetical protein [Gammaproteobacteria bacterium]
MYQQLALRKGHLWTTSVFLIFALAWLMPLAWLSVTYATLQLLFLAMAIAPLAVLCWLFEAGMPEQEEHL